MLLLQYDFISVGTGAHYQEGHRRHVGGKACPCHEQVQAAKMHALMSPYHPPYHGFLMQVVHSGAMGRSYLVMKDKGWFWMFEALFVVVVVQVSDDRIELSIGG